MNDSSSVEIGVIAVYVTGSFFKVNPVVNVVQFTGIYLFFAQNTLIIRNIQVSNRFLGSFVFPVNPLVPVNVLVRLTFVDKVVSCQFLVGYGVAYPVYKLAPF